MLGLILAAKMAMQLQLPPAPEGRVIVRLVAHDQDVTVRSTSAGVRYTASDKTGRPLASNLTLAELKQQCPAAYQLVQPATCDASNEIDASIISARD